jgi:hypothetical protein
MSDEQRAALISVLYPTKKDPTRVEAPWRGRDLQCPHDQRPSHPQLPDRQSMLSGTLAIIEEYVKFYSIYTT